ncbi:MAG: menaquinone biosynthesis protein [Bacteroidia bacterium]
MTINKKEKIKVSVVSYLNSQPFVYGLQHSDIIHDIDLQLDIPSVCAKKLIEGTVDIGLIPVAVIPELKEYYIISDYCIGAVGKVSSVMLYSQVPLKKIKNILLDYQSRTSVALVKVLSHHFWKITPTWLETSSNYEDKINIETAAVIIGDRTFGLEKKYAFTYDLAEEWQKYTHLPFVFACWVANKKISPIFTNNFNKALKMGLDNRPQLIIELIQKANYTIDVDTYLHKNISYSYNDEKQRALTLFLKYLDALYL